MKKIGMLLVVVGIFSCTKNEKLLKINYSDNENQRGYTLRKSSNLDNTKLYAFNADGEAKIKTETFTKNENGLSLHYNYPTLNENLNPLWKSFNQYIEETYVTNEDTVEKILNNDALSCDPLYEDATRIKRNIDYKVYKKNNGLLSILLYKTNYYDNEYHNSFMFTGLNYDLNKGTFITYKDLFIEKSESILLFKLNQELDAWIAADDSFKDCWKFTEDTFESVKNNFVLTDTSIRFYFDDCTVCPTYTGNHYLEIPLEELTHITKTLDQPIMTKKIN